MGCCKGQYFNQNHTNNALAVILADTQFAWCQPSENVCVKQETRCLGSLINTGNCLYIVVLGISLSLSITHPHTIRTCTVRLLQASVFSILFD